MDDKTRRLITRLILALIVAVIVILLLAIGFGAAVEALVWMADEYGLLSRLAVSLSYIR